METPKKPSGKNQYMKKKMALLRNKDRPIAIACYICGKHFLPAEGEDECTGLNFQSINEVNGSMYALCKNCTESLNNYIYELKHRYEVTNQITTRLEKLTVELANRNAKDDQINGFLESLQAKYGGNNEKSDVREEIGPA